MQRRDSDSTQFITGQLAGLRLSSDEKKATPDECEYVMVEKEDKYAEDFTEYELVKEFYFKTFAYLPNDLNAVLFKLYSDKYSLQETVSDPSFPRLAYHEFKKGDQLLLLSNVVSDSKARTTETYPLLRETLNHIRKNHSYNSNDILVIPIAEQTRNHYRLLVYKNGAFCYYDSKNPLYSFGARAYTFSSHVARETFADVSQAARQKFQGASGFLEHLKLSGELVGTLVIKTVINTLTLSSPVKEACSEFFPYANFTEYALTHQYMLDHNDCAIFAAAYGELTAEGQVPAALSENVIELRARYGGVKTDDVLSTTINTREREQELQESMVARCKA